MRVVVSVAGVGTLCVAGWLTLAAIVCDMAGSALVHLGDGHE